MNQLVIEFFASFRNSFRISAKNEGISALCRYMSTASNSRSWISVKHESRSNRAFSRTVQTSTLFSTDPQTNRRTFSETKKFFLNGDVKTSLLHKLSFRNETRSFLTLLPDSVLNGSTLNKHAPQRFRHRSVKTGDTSKEKGQESDLEDENDDDNEEEDEDGDMSHMTFPEDTGFPDNYRELKVHLKSLRLDAVVSAGINTARNKVDDYFLESKLKLNGERVLKKSKQMKIGDFVDLTMSVVDGKPHVKRVRVLQVDKNKTSKDKLKVTVRAWRTAVPVNYTSS